MKEIWKAVVNWEGYYEISNLGRVRSLDRVISTTKGSRRLKGRVRKPVPDGYGYNLYALSMNGKIAMRRAHVLVLTAFVGPPPKPKMHGCHNDGNPKNNKITNLRWDTKKGNAADKIRHGTHKCGDTCPASKLTEKQVRTIRKHEYADQYWANKLGVWLNTVYEARRGITWRHVK